MAPRKILFTGSRDASPEMLSMVDMYIRGNLSGRNVSVIVGDADGVDYRVIQTCDECEIPIEVFGGYGKMRHKTWTGRNTALPMDYLSRDKYMASLLDDDSLCVAVWNGESVKCGTVATARCALRYTGHLHWLWKKPAHFKEG